MAARRLLKKDRAVAVPENHDERVYNKCRYSVAGACNLPGTLGHKITLWGYHVAQKSLSSTK